MATLVGRRASNRNGGWEGKRKVERTEGGRLQERKVKRKSPGASGRHGPFFTRAAGEDHG